ncbi:MAG: MBOAT family protein, partial [Clostridia bacterium]|nr:MBOAT family protein [Clostridia bacterium]
MYLLLMICEIIITYVLGLLIKWFEGALKKVFLILLLVLSRGALGVFKYSSLFTDTVNALAGNSLIGAFKLHMPIGISFYTFQSISYGIDVYRGRHPAEKNILRMATYVSLFPQLIAGPIVRYEDVAKELRERKMTFSNFGEGAFRFVLGLGKKVLIADRLFAFCENAASANQPSMVLAWAEGLAFLMYVYFDFSGYSDMAIGLGKCLGIKFPENFNYPLISKSIREFWRRWHITLGSWFRDYLYIPLGGNRHGIVKQIRNLLIVWALTGLWHGASWNYVIWGLGFGVILVMETVLFKKTSENKENRLLRSIPRR